MLAIARWFHFWYQGIILNKVNIQAVFEFVNTGVRIVVNEISNFHIQHVNQFQIGQLCHLVDGILECLQHSVHCDY
jgi:hypothetical protein